MSKPIVLKTRHRLGVEAVKENITARFESLRRTVKIDRVGDARLSWDGDTAVVGARALGQQVHATIEVTEHDTTITIELPMLLTPFRGAIVAFVERQEDAVKDRPAAG